MLWQIVRGLLYPETSSCVCVEGERDMAVPTLSHPSLKPVAVVWRCLVVGLVYALVSMVTSSIGVLMVEMPIALDVDPATVFFSMFIGGILLALVMGLVSTKLDLPRAQRIGVLFLSLYTFAHLINAPEVLLYTNYPLAFQAYLVIDQLIVYLVVAILIGVLFPPPQVGAGLVAAVKGYFAQREARDWLWRFALAAVLFLPIYYFFGLVFSPMTVPYYNRPELGLGLVIPGLEVVVPVAIGRGLWYALTVIPLLAVLRMPKWTLGLWIGLILAIVGAVVPQVTNVAWPLPLRLGHGVEVVCDSFAQGLMMAWLLWVKK